MSGGYNFLDFCWVYLSDLDDTNDKQLETDRENEEDPIIKTLKENKLEDIAQKFKEHFPLSSYKGSNKDEVNVLDDLFMLSDLKFNNIKLKDYLSQKSNPVIQVSKNLKPESENIRTTLAIESQHSLSKANLFQSYKILDEALKNKYPYFNKAEPEKIANKDNSFIYKTVKSKGEYKISVDKIEGKFRNVKIESQKPGPAIISLRCNNITGALSDDSLILEFGADGNIKDIRPPFFIKGDNLELANGTKILREKHGNPEKEVAYFLKEEEKIYLPLSFDNLFEYKKSIDARKHLFALNLADLGINGLSNKGQDSNIIDNHLSHEGKEKLNDKHKKILIDLVEIFHNNILSNLKEGLLTESEAKATDGDYAIKLAYKLITSDNKQKNALFTMLKDPKFYNNVSPKMLIELNNLKTKLVAITDNSSNKNGLDEILGIHFTKGYESFSEIYKAVKSRKVAVEKAEGRGRSA